MSTDAFISHVAGHSGIPMVQAETVTRTVLSSLGAWLTPAMRAYVADELPAPLGAALLDTKGVAVPVEERLLQPGITAGRAHELVASVCRVLAEELSTEALCALRAATPHAIASLLSTSGPEIVTYTHAPRRYQTVASGRPGSGRPISEGRSAGWRR